MKRGIEVNIENNADELINTSSTSRAAFYSEEDTIEQLKTSEKLIAQLNETWEEKLRKTEEMK